MDSWLWHFTTLWLLVIDFVAEALTYESKLQHQATHEKRCSLVGCPGPGVQLDVEASGVVVAGLEGKLVLL